jgi:hypothetical protein
MAFTDWTAFRNFVFEFCNRRNQYIQSNFEHFLKAGIWRFIKTCLPLGALQEFSFSTSDNPSSPLLLLFRRHENYLVTTLYDMVYYPLAIPYAVEEIEATILYNIGTGGEYYETITLPYWKNIGIGKFWDRRKFEWFPPFWSFWNATRHIIGWYLVIYSPYPVETVIIRAIWLPTGDLMSWETIWVQYPYEIAKFTYYEVLLALSEWDEANMVWQECMKIAQEMRQQHGAKKLIIPYQQIDYLNPQAQAVRGGG